MRANTMCRGWLALFGLTAGCGSLFGVDFDDARLADADSGLSGEGGRDSGSADGNGSDGDKGPMPSVDGGFTCPTGTKPQGDVCVAKAWVGKKVAAHAIMGMWGSAKNDVYFIGIDGIYHSDGSGTWKAQSSQPKPTKAMGSSLMGLGPQSIIAIGGGAPYLMTSPQHWTPWTELGTCADSQSLWARSMNDVYAVAKNVICHSKNNGPLNTTFQPPDTLNAVWGSSTGMMYAVGSGETAPGIIYGSSGDDHWSEVGNTSGSLLGIWGIADDIYAVGASVVLRKHGSGGFVKQDSPSGVYYGIWGSSVDDLYIVGSRGRILHSSNGSVWTEEATNAEAIDLYAVWGSGADDVYAAGDEGWIFHLE